MLIVIEHDVIRRGESYHLRAWRSTILEIVFDHIEFRGILKDCGKGMLIVTEKVRWDKDIKTNHQDSVSPWEIDLFAPLPPSASVFPKAQESLHVASLSHLITGTSSNIKLLLFRPDA
ncbi:hypothetical protein Fmac_004604 [Flemingia macrophylla]|uniref:Uncharacterized protein n=1 Tax=Flemingia macrophylla TaxID=520843 RepID=A0ABD1N5K5_9FABA